MQQFPLVPERPLTRTQRWANALVVAAALITLGVGLIMKDQLMSGTQPFQDLAAGILAQYPSGWLLDRSGGYVFQVRDAQSSGFHTMLGVSILPIGGDAKARNVLDALTLERARSLAAYDVLSSAPLTLPDGDLATRLEYVYVASESNPFLQTVPTVVHGVDVVVIKRGQAIVVTFRAEADRFDKEEWRLEQFLASLEF